MKYILIIILSIFLTSCDRVLVDPGAKYKAKYKRQQAIVDSIAVKSKHIEYSFYYPRDNGYNPEWGWHTGMCDSFKIDGSQCTIYTNNDSIIYHNYPITFKINP